MGGGVSLVLKYLLGIDRKLPNRILSHQVLAQDCSYIMQLKQRTISKCKKVLLMLPNFA